MKQRDEMTERSNIEGYWDEFAEWCDDEGVSIEQFDDYGIFWACWNAALDAREAYELMARYDGDF